MSEESELQSQSVVTGDEEHTAETYFAAQHQMAADSNSFVVNDFVLEARASAIGPRLQSLAAQVFPDRAPGRDISSSPIAHEASKGLLAF